MYDKLIAIGQGAAIGVGYSILGYLKNATGEDFSGSKFFGDIISGAIAGGILGFSGIAVDMTSWTSSLLTVGSYAGLTITIERVAKAIWNYITRVNV